VQVLLATSQIGVASLQALATDSVHSTQTPAPPQAGVAGVWAQSIASQPTH
jgi:hypothetical protein